MMAVLCPSARFDDPAVGEKRIFAINGGTPEAPRVGYLPEPVLLTQAMVDAWKEAPIIPGEVYRIAGTCKREGCGHWKANAERCGLIDRWLVNLDPVVENLPDCPIRSTCRAFRQARGAACVRCVGFVTSTVHSPDDPLVSAAQTERTYL
jgi:hypothetical protein